MKWIGTKHQPGVALLWVIALLSMMSVVVLHGWFLLSFQCDIGLTREQWYDHVYATEAALNVGQCMVRDNFDRLNRLLREQKKPYVFDVSSLVNTVESLSRQARIAVVPCADPGRADALIICATLYEGAVRVCDLQSLMTKMTVRQDGKQGSVYVVSHYTLGASF